MSACIVFGLVSMVTGAAVFAVLVFGFGQSDPKWSPSHAYALTLLAVGVLSVGALPGFLTGTWSMAKLLGRVAPGPTVAALAGVSYGASFPFGWWGVFPGLVGLVAAVVALSLCLGVLAVLLSPSHEGTV